MLGFDSSRRFTAYHHYRPYERASPGASRPTASTYYQPPAYPSPLIYHWSASPVDDSAPASSPRASGTGSVPLDNGDHMLLGASRHWQLFVDGCTRSSLRTAPAPPPDVCSARERIIALVRRGSLPRRRHGRPSGRPDVQRAPTRSTPLKSSHTWPLRPTARAQRSHWWVPSHSRPAESVSRTDADRRRRTCSPAALAGAANSSRSDDAALKAERAAVWRWATTRPVAAGVSPPWSGPRRRQRRRGRGPRARRRRGVRQRRDPGALAGADVVASDLTPSCSTPPAPGRRACRCQLPAERRRRGAAVRRRRVRRRHVQVGVMFAPHHQVAADELVRVVPPRRYGSGSLSWTPQGFIGQMFAVMKPYAAPPPPGAQPPPLWGDEAHVASCSATGSPTSTRSAAVRVDRFDTPRSSATSSRPATVPPSPSTATSPTSPTGWPPSTSAGRARRPQDDPTAARWTGSTCCSPRTASVAVSDILTCTDLDVVGGIRSRAELCVHRHVARLRVRPPQLHPLVSPLQKVPQAEPSPTT